MRAQQVEDLVSRLGPGLDPLGIVAFRECPTWGIARDVYEVGIVQIVDRPADGLDVPRLAEAPKAWRETVRDPQPSRAPALHESSVPMIRI